MHETRDVDLGQRLEQAGRLAGGPAAGGVQGEREQDQAFGPGFADQGNLPHAPRLTKPIDPASTLLESRRPPRQVEVQHDAAAVVKVEALGRSVRRQQHRASGMEAALGA